MQPGAAERSYVRTIDVQFDRTDAPSAPVLSNLIANNRVRLVRHPLSGAISANDPTVPLAGVLHSVDHTIEFDFGALGLGGVARGSLSLAQYWSALAAADGYYEIEVDLDGSGAFATHEFFYRLLGDVGGNQVVDQADVDEIAKAMIAPTLVTFGDANGNGTVDSDDTYLARRSKGRSLAGGLHLDG